jgi:hypothetical protein
MGRKWEQEHRAQNQIAKVKITSAGQAREKGDLPEKAADPAA